MKTHATVMTKNIERHMLLLESIANLSDKGQKTIISGAKRYLILAIIEICKKLKNGTFLYSKAERNQLKRYNNRIRKLSMREKLSKGFHLEKKLINYRGNIGFLSKIIGIAKKNLRVQQIDETSTPLDTNRLMCHVLQMRSQLDDMLKLINSSKNLEAFSFDNNMDAGSNCGIISSITGITENETNITI